MPDVDFTCPKCGEEATADVPSGGAKVECPACEAVVRVTPPSPLKKPAPKRVKAAVEEDVEEEDYEEQERPRKKKGKSKKSLAKKGVPVWAWGAGGVGVLAVVVLGLVLALGKSDKPNEPVAKANPTAPADSKTPPPKVTPAPIPNPPMQETPKKDPAKKDSPPVITPKVDLQPQPGEDIDKDWPTLPARKRQVEPWDSPNRTTIRWFAPPTGSAPLVILDLPTEPYPPRPGPHRGHLARELARQSLLMAAREEFGASTRDAVLREPPGDVTGYTPAGTFELAWIVTPGKNATASLSTRMGDAKRVFWQLEIALPDAAVLDYNRLATALEEAARGPLAEALAKETNASRVPVKPSDARSPSEAQAGLKSVNYFDQIAAIRLLHAANRSGGESPTILTDLSRGYATLGLMTEHLDVVSHKAFKARALLYANRAVARNSPTGRWALAHASCLVGLHKQALEQAKAAGGGPPGWAKVIEPYCHYDYAALKALPYEEVGPIADVLRFLAVENKYTPTHPIGIGVETLQLHRDCFRLYDGVTKIAGLGVQRALTDEAPQAMSTALADHIAKFPNLPPAGTAVLGKVRSLDAAAERTLLQAMDTATDPGEPSLASLAAIVREERLRHLIWRKLVYDVRLNLPAIGVEETRKALPFLVDHPLYGVLAATTVPQSSEEASRVIPRSEIQLWGSGWRMNNEGGLYGLRPDLVAELAHADDADFDLRLRQGRHSPNEQLGYLDTFLKVSPYSPVARFHMIQTDWAKAEGEAARWEKESASFPAVLAALGQKYLDLVRYDDAERMFLAAAKLAPENRCYMPLVTIYGQVRKNEAKMLAIMEDRLKHPNDGLEIARMRIRIAEVYALRKDYKTALGYAERAAQDSGAEWAMIPTISYANLVGDKAKAALWEQQRRERYGGGLPRP